MFKRPPNKSDWQISMLIFLAYLRVCLIVIFIAVLPLGYYIYATEREVDRRARESWIASCERVNLVRAQMQAHLEQDHQGQTKAQVIPQVDCVNKFPNP